MTLQLPVSFFIHTSLSIWRKFTAKNEDCISKLPDEILASILSHLTVKEAVRTRELSKGWRHLYLSYLHTSGSNLNFDLSMATPIDTIGYVECHKYRSAFVKLVNNFLDQYKGPNISSFRVSFCLGRKCTSNIDRWITYAVKLDVENLHISFVTEGCHSCELDQLYIFPFQLLSEASKLNFLFLRSCIIKPDFSCRVHSLKVLDLFNISINQSILLCILSTCSNVERMMLFACLCAAVLSFRSPFLQLKLLTISYCEGLKEIELSAAHLTDFEHFNDDPSVNIVFTSFVRLKSIHSAVPGNVCYIFNKMANSFTQLQSLSMACFSTRIWTNSLPSAICTFGNLMQLEFSLTDYPYAPYDIRTVIPFISACPILQKFHLMVRHIRSSSKNNEDRSMKQYNKRIYTQLKDVKMSGFDCKTNQVELAVYLLGNSIALERMIISSRCKTNLGFGHSVEQDIYPMDVQKREWLFQELQGKATSKGAQVIIQ